MGAIPADHRYQPWHHRARALHSNNAADLIVQRTLASLGCRGSDTRAKATCRQSPASPRTSRMIRCSHARNLAPQETISQSVPTQTAPAVVMDIPGAWADPWASSQYNPSTPDKIHLAPWATFEQSRRAHQRYQAARCPTVEICPCPRSSKSASTAMLETM